MILSAKSLGTVERKAVAGKVQGKLANSLAREVTRLGVPIEFDPKFP